MKKETKLSESIPVTIVRIKLNISKVVLSAIFLFFGQ